MKTIHKDAGYFVAACGAMTGVLGSITTALAYGVPIAGAEPTALDGAIFGGLTVAIGMFTVVALELEAHE